MQSLFTSAAAALFVVVLTLGSAKAADLQVEDVVAGTGAEATSGSKVSVHYTGWLLDGTKFDSSKDRGKPFDFTIDGQQVIAGWDMGVKGMKVGGTRRLIIPPELGYGKRGAGRVIPSNATLKFEVELLAVKEPAYKNVSNAELEALMSKGVPVIDIRRPEEWKQTGVVEGSKLLTLFDKRGNTNPAFMKKFAALVGKEQEVVLICRTGNRTRAASTYLAERMGYSGVHNVTRGITHWIREGRPVDKGATMPVGCWLC